MSKGTPSRINIEVTQEDIDRAHRNDSYTCVVSQAIARTVRDATNIDVDTQSIRFTVDNERRLYLTPYAVQGYVIAFDAGDSIEPFGFQLRDPRRVARKMKTEAGKAAQRAANKARRTTQRETAAKASSSDHIANEDTPGKAPERDDDNSRKAAKAAYAEARVAHPGPALISDRGGRKSPPRVWKRKKRAYGHRLLRINQEDSNE